MGRSQRRCKEPLGGSVTWQRAVPGVPAASAELRVTPRCLWAALIPRHSPGACRGRRGHDPRREGDCGAPALSSFQRSQAESLGSFFCFSHICSLLELIYPCGSQSYIREGHVSPL